MTQLPPQIEPGLGLRSPKIWLIEIDFSKHPAKLSVQGEGCQIRDQEHSKEVYWDNCGFWEPLLKLGTSSGSLCVPTGHVCPVYAAWRGNTLAISNLASNTLPPHSSVQIDEFTFLQNLSGIPYPQKNPLKATKLLEASGQYSFDGKRFVRERSLLENGSVLSPDEVFDLALAGWERHLKSCRDVAILLSGGYDSRLNLAVALHFSKKYGYRIKAFHEHKNEQEESIARAVAEAAGVELLIQRRDFFVSTNRSVITDSTFIDVQSGFYRDNLIRWHKYLSFINQCMPGCLIMGLGAEAHKGKYYSHIQSLHKDAPRVFGIDPIIPKTIGKGIGLSIKKDSQSQFFKILTDHAQAFPTHSAQVDFLHYQTYISYGYGHRCHNLQQYFGIPFPFLDTEFLAAVFALPQEDKEGFKIVKRGIEKLAPKLQNIKFTSANDKSLKTPKPEPLKKIIKTGIRAIGPNYYYWRKPRLIGRQQATDQEKTIIQEMLTRTSSPFLRSLLKTSISNKPSTPFLRLDYLIEACFYLDHLEQKKGIRITANGYDK